MSEKLQKAKALVDGEQYELAVNILNSLDELSPKDERYKLLLLSYSLYNLKKYDLAIHNTNRMLQTNNKDEYASQIKYLCHCDLKEYDNALREITEFLSFNKANLYKATLGELLTDIKKGNIIEKEMIEKIKTLALQNNVNV